MTHALVLQHMYIYIYMLWLGNTPFFPTRNVSLHAKYSYLAIAPNRSPEMWSTWPRRSTTFNFGVSTPSKAQPSQTRESSGNCRRWTRMVPALSIHLWWAHQRKTQVPYDDLQKLKSHDKPPPVALTESEQHQLDPLRSKYFQKDTLKAEAQLALNGHFEGYLGLFPEAS